jgi:hypothetical protein
MSVLDKSTHARLDNINTLAMIDLQLPMVDCADLCRRRVIPSGEGL